MLINMTKQRKDGWWYPYIFVVGMLVVIIVNAIMVNFALDTFPGLETKDHYKKGVAYNEALVATEAQEKLGWQLTSDFVADRPGEGSERSGLVSVQFAGPDGAPLAGLRVKAFFLRPTHEGVDREVLLEPGNAGHYRGRVTLPLPGNWNLRIHAAQGDARFQSVDRLFID